MKLLLALPLLLLLSSCSWLNKPPPEPIIVTQTEYVNRFIPIQERPKPVSLYDVEFYAVTRENLDEFLQRFERDNGSLVFFAISVPDYENIALNIAELRRFIESQNATILYYEENVNAEEQIKENP